MREDKFPAKNRIKCSKCNGYATYMYLPGNGYYCEKHVPRGCECAEDPSEVCCEYLHEPGGFEDSDDAWVRDALDLDIDIDVDSVHKEYEDNKFNMLL